MGEFGYEEVRKNKSSWCGKGEKSQLLWDRKHWDAKRDMELESWHYCSAT